MDKSFEILKWDSVKDNYDKIKPIFYFRPNMEFIIHCKNNKNKIKIDVQSESYNLQNVDANIDKLNEISVLPNLSSQDVIYIAIINTPFTKIDKSGTFNVSKQVIVSNNIDMPSVDMSGIDMSGVNVTGIDTQPIENFDHSHSHDDTQNNNDDIKESYNLFTKFNINAIVLIVCCVFFMFYFTLLTISEFDQQFEKRKVKYYIILTILFSGLSALYCYLK